ncbi:MAG: F0F1 ATP synthase subunit B [Anaerolineaceae bacterium]|nr:F0F1 ATP synthase subunit B [Anaerolineaceae bacterium]
MEALGINLGYLLIQIIAFIVIYVLLTRFVYDPLIAVLRDRRTRIQRGLEDAEKAANARMNAEAEAEKVLQQARNEAQGIVDEARGRGEEVAQQVQQDARSEAETIRNDARLAAQAERDAQLAGLRGQVAAISIAVAQQLIGASLDEARQQALINDFFAKVPDSARTLSGDVTVVSAMPLDDAEQQKVQEEIGADSVAFEVDPSILGGLIVRSADQVVDGSVRSGLGEMSQRLG